MSICKDFITLNYYSNIASETISGLEIQNFPGGACLQTRAYVMRLLCNLPFQQPAYGPDIYTAIVSLLFGTVIPTSFNILML